MSCSQIATSCQSALCRSVCFGALFQAGMKQYTVAGKRHAAMVVLAVTQRYIDCRGMQAIVLVIAIVIVIAKAPRQL